ncbi:carbohydrate-binding domain-containing protein, partial [Roseicella aquatilis]
PTAPIDYVVGPDGNAYYVDLVTNQIGRLDIVQVTSGGGVTPPPTGGGTTVGTGPDSLVLRVSQDAYQGNAQFTVRVDGVQVGGVLTATALHAAGLSDTITIKGDWGAGTHNVVVTFVNDVWGGSAAADRNLYLESVSYNGTTLANSSAPLFSQGEAHSVAFTDSGTGTPPPTGGSTTIGTGSDSLVLRVSQDEWQGDAQFTVKVDGVQVGGTLTAAALHAAGLSDTITIKGDWGAGTHNVVVTFVNDAWGGSTLADRNLYLESVSYNGTTLANSSAPLFSQGEAHSVAFTDSGTGTPPPTGGSTTIGTGSDSLVLRVSQDEWQGDAQFTVKVDGVQVGGTLTAAALHTAGLSDTITIKGDWGAGTHNVVVTFVNDAWGGSAAADRNLYLESVSYNGATLANSSAPLFSSGEFHNVAFTDSGTGTPPPTGGSTTVGTGPDSLVLRVSEDAYQGNAQFTVKVDGVQVGGTLTTTALHAAGLSDTITIKGDWGAGTHNVVVTFINDVWGGSTAADRNLYLESVSYNGATLANSSAPLFSQGEFHSMAFTDYA